jgi:hypothetical protein
MTGIQFVTDEKGRRMAVQIDLKKHGAVWQDFLTASFPNRAAKKRAFLTSNTAPTA